MVGVKTNPMSTLLHDWSVKGHMDSKYIRSQRALQVPGEASGPWTTNEGAETALSVWGGFPSDTCLFLVSLSFLLEKQKTKTSQLDL